MPPPAADQKASFKLNRMLRGHCAVPVTFPKAELVMVVLGALNMAQVRTVLEATRHIEPDFKVGETLEALAPAYPHDAVVCVARMAEGSPQDWTIYGIRDHVLAILKIALGSANVEAKAAAERLVQYLVARGHFEYRDLLS